LRKLVPSAFEVSNAKQDSTYITESLPGCHE